MPPDVIKLPHRVKIMIMIVCGFRKCDSPGAVTLIARLMTVLTALMPRGGALTGGARYCHVPPHPQRAGDFWKTEGNYHIDERSSDVSGKAIGSH